MPSVTSVLGTCHSARAGALATPWGCLPSVCVHVLLLLHTRAGRSCPERSKGLRQEQPVFGMEEGSPGKGARMRAGRVVEDPHSSPLPLPRHSLGSGRRRRGQEPWRGTGRGDPVPQGAPPAPPPPGEVRDHTGTLRVRPEREESPEGCSDTRSAAAMLQHPLHPPAPHRTSPSIPTAPTAPSIPAGDRWAVQGWSRVTGAQGKVRSGTVPIKRCQRFPERRQCRATLHRQGHRRDSPAQPRVRQNTRSITRSPGTF